MEPAIVSGCKHLKSANLPARTPSPHPINRATQATPASTPASINPQRITERRNVPSTIPDPRCSFCSELLP